MLHPRVSTQSNNIFSLEVSMEAEARQQKHPGADTNCAIECKRTVKKAVGGDREAVAWHKAEP